MLWKCCTQSASKFWKLSSFHRTVKGQFSLQSQKKGNAKECLNYCTNAIISRASKVMFKILQARLQQYVNRVFPDVWTRFLKGRGTRDQIANIHWIIEKAREFRKKKKKQFTFASLTMLKSLTMWITTGIFLKRWKYPDHLSCLLRNLYAGQEATVRTRYEAMNCFQIGKGVRQGCILSLCLFKLYAEYIMQNTRLRKHKLKSRLLGEVSITWDMQMTPPFYQKAKRN